MPVKTLNSKNSDAEICRANGWGSGTRLIGTEGEGEDWERTDLMEITAVGEELLLARAVYGDNTGEGIWTLKMREWRKWR